MRTNFLVDDTEYALLKDIRAAEFKRMLMHAQTSTGRSIPAELITQLESRLNSLKGYDSLNELAVELIIARWLSAKTQRDLGRI